MSQYGHASISSENWWIQIDLQILLSILSTQTARAADVSSNLVIVICFNRVTLDFPNLNAPTIFFPQFSILKYDTVPRPFPLAVELWMFGWSKVQYTPIYLQCCYTRSVSWRSCPLPRKDLRYLIIPANIALSHVTPLVLPQPLESVASAPLEIRGWGLPAQILLAGLHYTQSHNGSQHQSNRFGSTWPFLAGIC